MSAVPHGSRRAGHGVERAFCRLLRAPAPRVAAGFAAAGIVLLVVFEWLPIDLSVQRALFDPLRGDFRWHRDPQIEFWLHVQARRILYAFPAFAALGWFVHRRAARCATHPARRAHSLARAATWRFVLVALLAAPSAVSLAKQWTDRPCPWDLAEFGGGARGYGLFEPAPPGARALACFPAGHASGGFALFAFALAAASTKPRRHRTRAFAWFVVSVSAGLLLGGVRVIQGAHFVSHVLWSAWLVWLVQWTLARWLLVSRSADSRQEDRPGRR